MTALAPSEPSSPEGSATMPVAFWLLPGDADRQWLQTLMGRLAREHGGPDFEAHVTLHTATCRRDADLEGLMDRLALSCPLLSLTALATGESATYFKTLFVNFAADGADGERMVELRRRLVTALLGLRDASDEVGDAATKAQALEQALASYSFQPHLSLLYAHLAQPLRTALAEQHDYRGRRLAFDTIAAVRPAPGRPDLAQVADWEVFAHRRLRG